MHRRVRTLGVTVLLVTVAMAGCFGGDEGPPTSVEATASQPLVARSWAQDGEGLVETTGQARLVADQASASGSFTGNLTLGDVRVELSADTFSGRADEPWTADGVNGSIALHGDTQRGTAELPRVTPISATWGPVVVTQDGEVLADPLTGQPEMFAHVLLLANGIRSDEDGTMQTQNGSVYGPDRAGEGRTFAGDTELHAIVTSSPDATAREDETIEEEGSFQPPSDNATVTVPIVQRLAGLNVSVALAPAADTDVTPAEVNATLLDPSGSTLRAATLGGQANDSVTWQLAALPAAGNYSVAMEAQGAADWNVTAEIDHPDPFMLYATYEQVGWQAAGDG